ncbi:TraB/GumN family protein [Phenylobacterium sp.]|uniref:TraB/GumN family protein n=1 Tax=Phenylobacterium sp. TaxID=1871053 RepID=UPI0025DB5B37|nr:TraB/GumN family protein [Phenylobacterium sp.]
MKRISCAVLAGLAVAVAGAGRAQPPRPKLDDPEGNIVEELVVTAKERGPAWWRVSDDDTTVYILALPDAALPADLTWDMAGLQRRLKGSNALIGGGRSYKLGLGNIGLLFSLRRSLRTKGTMEDDLPEPVRARFVALRQGLGKDPKHYAGWGPMVAGFILVGDARLGPRGRDAEEEVRRAARRLRVRERRLEAHDAAPFIKEFKAGLTDDIQGACLDAAMDDVEAGQAAAAEAARGWARGDVAAALKAPRGFEKCFLAISGGAAAWNQTVGDQAAEIAEALKTPGKAVAMVRLRPLIARGGVIERLEAIGLEVEGPAGR